MPRIRQNADKYALADLSGELRCQMSRKGYTQDDLAKSLHISQGTVSKYIKNPGVIPMNVFRGMVALLQPDVGICLAYLKFGKQAIKEAAE